MDKEGIHIPKMFNPPHKLFEPITLLFIVDYAVCPRISTCYLKGMVPLLEKGAYQKENQK